MAGVFDDPRFQAFAAQSPDLAAMIAQLGGAGAALPEGATVSGPVASMVNKAATLQQQPMQTLLKAGVEAGQSEQDYTQTSKILAQRHDQEMMMMKQKMATGAATATDMEILKHQHAREIQDAKDAAVLRVIKQRQAGDLTLPTELGKVAEEASILAHGRTTAEGDPRLKGLIAQMLGMGAPGENFVKGIEKQFDLNTEKKVMDHMDAFKTAAKAGGLDLSEAELTSTEDAMRTRIQRGGAIDIPGIEAEHREAQTKAQAKKANVEAAEKRLKAENPSYRVGQRLTLEEAAKRAASKTPGPEQEAFFSEVAASERGAAGHKRGLIGLLGGAGAALLISKMMGSQQPDAATNALPPEAMLAMMKASAARGAGGGEPDEEVGTGRSLLNMQRAIGVMKMMQQMGGMNSAAISPASLV